MRPNSRPAGSPRAGTARRLLARLRPRVGRRLPPELRARRVGELARRLAGGVRDPAFPPLLSRIDDGALVHAGNRVELYFRGDDAFRSMREAIAGARREVLLESYLFKDDATGRAVFEALQGAAGRGVAVRVLADAFGSFGTHSSFWREIEASGIELRLFNPLLRRLWYQAYRDHRKILVVDRRTAFTGGMNIGDEYGSFGKLRSHTWRDTHARVDGPVAEEMALVFAEGWSRAQGPPFELAPPAGNGGEGARVLVLDSRPGRGHAEAASVLAAIVGAARRSVWITNAYFAPGRVAIDVLGQAADRGVDVRLLLPGRSDVPIVRHAGHGWFAALLARGVRIFEYRPAILHAKSLVADGYASVVGSTNLDFRSFQYNAECNLVILDEDTGGRLADTFAVDTADAEEIEPASWSRRGNLHRLGDRLARTMSPLL